MRKFFGIDQLFEIVAQCLSALTEGLPDHCLQHIHGLDLCPFVSIWDDAYHPGIDFRGWGKAFWWHID